MKCDFWLCTFVWLQICDHYIEKNFLVGCLTQKWPQRQPQSIQVQTFSCRGIDPDPLSCCVLIHYSATHPLTPPFSRQSEVPSFATADLILMDPNSLDNSICILEAQLSHKSQLQLLFHTTLT